MSYAKTLREVTHLSCRPNKTTILGITGYAGAGKHSVVAPKVLEYAQELEFDAHVLELDSFFIQSRTARANWLEKVRNVDDEEYAKRSDLQSWWAFYEAQSALNELRNGRDLFLTEVYDRDNDGELTGTIDISPSSKGSLIVLVGVAIIRLIQEKDELVFIHALPEVRKRRLLGRDTHRIGTEAEERFRITEEFDHKYFHSDPNFCGRPLYFIDNSIDDEHDFRVEYLNQLGMPPSKRKKYYCKTAVSET